MSIRVSHELPFARPAIRRFGAALVILTWLVGAPSPRVRAPDPETWEFIPASAAARADPALPSRPASAHPRRPFPIETDAVPVSGFPLPDLQTLPPGDLRIRYLASGRRLLRFSNTIWNRGTAALEVSGQVNPFTRAIELRQRLLISGDTAVERPIGRFVWHPTHGHWHIEEFALYQLWSITPYGEPDQLLSTSEKLSYCLIDTDPLNLQLAGFVPQRTYRGCGRMRQGISVGWGDEYASYLDGQAVDITGLPDGVYA
ncbi:MAG: lysyl oxidase family protein, partial [Anaerolineales bacterium]